MITFLNKISCIHTETDRQMIHPLPLLLWLVSATSNDCHYRHEDEGVNKVNNQRLWGTSNRFWFLICALQITQHLHIYKPGRRSSFWSLSEVTRFNLKITLICLITNLSNLCGGGTRVCGSHFTHDRWFRAQLLNWCAESCSIDFLCVAFLFSTGSFCLFWCLHSYRGACPECVLLCRPEASWGGKALYCQWF